MIKYFERIKSLLNRGDNLSVKVKKHIIFSFFLKGLSILSGFILVPLTLNYIGVEEYGIWLTLSSIIAWFGYFDVGIGNGLKNKLAASLAIKDYKSARIYVSTSYAGVSLIFGSMLVVFLSVNPFLNWADILNTSEVSASQMYIIVQIVGSLFLIQFILRLIGTIFAADNRPSISNSILPVSQILSLLIIYILTITTDGSLLYVSVVYAGMPAILWVFVMVFFFRGEYRHLRPAVKYVDFKHFKELINLGFKFLILQLSVMVIFTTDNLIITRILGPEHVTPYNIAFKYFNLVKIAFSIILAPTWAAYATAYSKNDFNWIKGVMKKMVLIFFGFFGLTIFMVLISDIFYNFWVGDKVKIDFLLSVFMALSFMLAEWGRIYVMFINATGKISLQLYLTLFGALINIPLSIYFAQNLGMGSTGVILATSISILPGTFLYPYQYKLILNKKDRGIWSK